MNISPQDVEINFVPNTEKLDTLTTALIDLLESLVDDFKEFRYVLRTLDVE